MKHDLILITDIGSTTTKAILIDASQTKLLGIAHADTTVEAPFSDVSFGVINAVKQLELSCGISLLKADANPEQPAFQSGIRYYSTSSAGGGLQILVIGLTLFDSASSAKRAAYGAGGIILDVFAIDDKRKNLEQMLAMRNLRPDMILLCGGTDGGALSSVLRMAEILRIAKPLPKFATEVKIPALYAGNQDAVPLIQRMISRDFDLHILPNLRPTLETENLKPTQDKIQELFMENVMERAPGYNKIKGITSSSILPTPAGVLSAMQQIPNPEDKYLLAFDIGGATTDVFSRINGHFHRTVSANLGMSYSALNVLAEIGIESLLSLLPNSINEHEIRDYIGNKTLYPTSVPQNSNGYRIEHALAKCALKLALAQHHQMHYSAQKVGYLDKLKNSGRDQFEAKFEYIKDEEKHSFYPSDVDILIGAGGIFAHAQKPEQSIDILISGFSPKGITEICIDRHFITPHLGVLSTQDPRMSALLLDKDCLQYLALHISPFYPARMKGVVLTARIEEPDQKPYTQVLMPDSFVLLKPVKGRKVILQASKKCYIKGETTQCEVTTDLPVIFDTRRDDSAYNKDVEQILDLYSYDSDNEAVYHKNEANIQNDNWLRDVVLPYNGETLVNAGQYVKPDDVIAVNRFNPPRLFVVSPFTNHHDCTETEIRESLLVNVGDRIDFDMPLTKPLPGFNRTAPFLSPVRGKVEHIDYQIGMLIIVEIQDYSAKPVSVALAEKLMLTPRKALRYVKKSIGDFVYQGDILAQRLESNTGAIPTFVKAPATGEIIKIDLKTAELTIKYKSEPHNYLSHVYGKVVEVTEGKSVKVEYRAQRVEGKIGWGAVRHGKLYCLNNPDSIDPPSASIVALKFVPDLQILMKLSEQKAVAIVCAQIPEALAVEYLGHEQGVINTGNEIHITPLILIDGFGTTGMAGDIWKLLSERNGKMCLVEPHTRIRAGVARPHISFLSE